MECRNPDTTFLQRHFRWILTDHKSLQHCLDATNDKTKGQRIARSGSLYLSDFNYKVRYLKGADNAVADILSRLVLVAQGSPLTRRRTGGCRTEIMGSLAALLQSRIPSVRNALLEGQYATAIEAPHAAGDPRAYQAGTDLDLDQPLPIFFRLVPG